MDYLRVAFGAQNLSSWCLFGLGIVGAIVAWFTLQDISDQAKSGKDSADAARKAANAAQLSAESQMNAERSWLIIGPKMEGFVPNQDRNPTFSWQIKNVGKTPSRLIETQAIYEAVDSASLLDLPETPVYPQPIELNGLLLAPEDSMPFSTFLVPSPQRGPGLTQQDSMRIGNGTIHLRACGYVKYLDTFGEEHVSRFCHSFVLRPTGPIQSGFKWLLGVPPAYFEHT